MNAKNLPLKFGLVALLAALCVWSVVVKGLNAGIDLAGGHSMIFQIRTNQAEIEGLQAQQQALQEQIAQLQAAGNAAEAQKKQDELKGIEQEIQRLQAEGGDQKGLAEKMIAILKDRVDPQGLRSLQWRPVGKTRIEVRMPASSPESQKAKRAYLEALEKFEAGNLQRSEVSQIVQASGQRRAEMIAEMAGENEALAAELRAYAQAADAVVAATAEVNAAEREPNAAAALRTARDRLLNTRDHRDELGTKLYQHNVPRSAVESILRNYLSPREKETMQDHNELTRLVTAYNESLQTLRGRVSGARLKQLDGVVDLYTKWASQRQYLEDPSDLKRLLAKAGVLEFRIAPFPEYYRGANRDQVIKLPQHGNPTAPGIEEYRAMLDQEGPRGVRKKNLPYAWFEVRSEAELESFILADYAGRTYMLLSTQPGRRMVQIPGQTTWRLKNAYPGFDRNNRPCVDFEFNAAGAGEFYHLTSTNINQAMAILLDDEVFSAPTIQSAISNRGQITGRFTQDEVNELVRLLEAGSLPGRLDPNPVSENTTEPSLGAANRARGLQAAYIGLIAVAAFMAVYYLLGGLIADVALCLNVLLVLGVMSMLDAVFTLPGIAGIILTIGIAIDANVLIFERLREEQAKNQSVRMALKNAYERAFSAIFDANATTLITCLILAWIGTTEVRGFAITLGLGVLFSLFTALIITRWIFQALVDARLIKRPLKMLTLIGVPKINWMGKRRLFWGISGTMMVLGVASLVWQGSDIWGIQFSAGTQVTITFEHKLVDGELPSTTLVTEKLKTAADKAGDAKIRDTLLVEAILDAGAPDRFLSKYDRNSDGKVTAEEWREDGGDAAYFNKLASGGAITRADLQERLTPRTYQLTTTEANMAPMLGLITDLFGPELQKRSRVEYRLVESGQELGLPWPADGKMMLTADQIAKADPSLRPMLEDYENGLAMIVRTPQASLSDSDYRARLEDMRIQPDFDSVNIDQMSVTGLTPAGQLEPNAGPARTFLRFLVLVRPSDPDARIQEETWNSFVNSAYTWAVQTPLEREEAYVVTNFDPEIAASAAGRAVMAVLLSCVAIVLYLWFRFGSAQWGLAAVVCLVHDVVIVVGLVAVSGWLHGTIVGRALLVDSFKIDLALVAAFLTVIGYSVNDTIVVFDRIRENRGKLSIVTPEVINLSVNQTLSRTLLTSGTTLIVVVIMYIWGGDGIHAFNYALLAGILFGTYSSVAVAAPLLLGFKQAVVAKVSSTPATA